jgi:hypothetical protein
MENNKKITTPEEQLKKFKININSREFANFLNDFIDKKIEEKLKS